MNLLEQKGSFKHSDPFPCRELISVLSSPPGGAVKTTSELFPNAQKPLPVCVPKTLWDY